MTRTHYTKELLLQKVARVRLASQFSPLQAVDLGPQAVALGGGSGQQCSEAGVRSANRSVSLTASGPHLHFDANAAGSRLEKDRQTACSSPSHPHTVVPNGKARVIGY